jgi:hypothetical protein
MKETLLFKHLILQLFEGKVTQNVGSLKMSLSRSQIKTGESLNYGLGKAD